MGRQVPYCMVTDPELAHIGLSETDARKGGITYRLAKIPMTTVLRTRTLSGQITMKAFGRDRQPGSAPDYSNGSEPAVLTSGGLVPRQYVNEPRQHGDFTRYKIPADPKNPNYRFTEPDYWKAEPSH
jgi:hypothetical protein